LNSLTARRKKITEIISNNRFSSQTDIIDALKAAGFSVTQPTLSRDFKEMAITREQSKDGAVYTLPKVSYSYKSIFAGSIKSIKRAVNIVVIACESGTAGAVCTLIDKLSLSGVVGTIAGDDTIFAACDSEKSAVYAIAELSNFAGL
jgi:transcriptional regulator of arginine metabolism